MGMNANTFIAFLDLLGMKHPKAFTEQQFDKSKHKINLF